MAALRKEISLRATIYKAWEIGHGELIKGRSKDCWPLCANKNMIEFLPKNAMQIYLKQHKKN